MTPTLEIRTLGGLSFHLDNEPVRGFPSRKVEALLVYIALAKRPFAREVLAELFWPERSRAAVQSNLRSALTRLRQAAGPYLTITRTTVSFNLDSPYWLDVEALESRLMDIDDQWSPPSQATASLLGEALDLYRGEFLEGVYVDSADFEEWALVERERLRFLVATNLDRLVNYSLEHEAYRQGVSQATKLLQLDSLREETYRQLMLLLAQSGQRSAALAQYDLCRRVLGEELGVEPTAETRDLYEAIKTDRLSRPAARITPEVARCAIPQHNLPAQPTSFVGRQNELDQIGDLLANPDRRLVSIIGPAGIGKTRMGLQVAEQQVSRFADGVFFVPLAGLGAVSAISTTIARMVGCVLRPGPDSPQDQLLNYLVPKELLLVLDNFEHLLDGADQVAAILAAAPQVKALVTSRQALNLNWEWQFHLQGLPVPEDSATVIPESFDAVRLFVERAKRVNSAFQLAMDRDGVIRICQMVEGLPLGIELAAAWLRVMSCQDIAQELLNLEAPSTEWPERHRSLRVLFDHSWHNLSQAEQQVLMKLSVFRGGFRRDAAEAIAGASLPLLASLVNKSLLQADIRSSRYELHQLLKQYAAEKLADYPAEAQQTQSRHCTYYTTFLHQREGQTQGDQQSAVVQEIDREIDNIRAAWQRAVVQGDLEAVDQALTGLSTFLNIRSWNQEAIETFSQPLTLQREGLAKRPPLELKLQMSLISPLMATRGYADPALSRALNRAWELSLQMEDSAQLWTVFYLLTTLFGVRAEHRQAGEVGQRLLSVAQSIGDPFLIAVAHESVGRLMIWRGELTPALSHMDHALDFYDPAQHGHFVFVYGHDIGVSGRLWTAWALWMLGYPDQALTRSQEALALAETLGHEFTLAFAQSVGGALFHAFRLEIDPVQQWAEKLESLSSEQGFAFYRAAAIIEQGWVLVERGQIAEGIARMEQGLSAYRATGSGFIVPQGLVWLAIARAKAGQIEQGLALLEQARRLVDETDERYYEPELYRVRGDLLLARGDELGAEENFHKALALARDRQMKSWELRATISLARLNQQQGLTDEARQRLSAIYQWFSEGLDTVDLKTAQALLQELADA